MRRDARPRGFTFIELAIVLALVGLLSAMVAPTLGAMLARHRLLQAAHTLQADLAYARQEGLRRGLDAHLQFQPGQPWCYALSLGQPADCRLNTKAPHELKRVQGEQFSQVMLLQANPMLLDGRSGLRRGALSQAMLATPTGPKLVVQLGAMGRASLCTALPLPQKLPGVPPCTVLAEP